MKRHKVLIIQLTRIGDLIQTLQAARQLKAENPNILLGLVARKKFANGIDFLLETVFDELYLFDTKDFFIKKDLTSAKNEVHSFINIINKEKYDLTINLSFTKASAYLSSTLNASVKFGLQRNSRNEIVINDKWSQFVYSNTMNHAHTPFSLVDIYRYIMGVKETLVLDPDPDFDKRAQNIVIHPFASQKKKKWGLSKWSELIYKLAKDNPHYHFHIVGAPEDVPEVKRLLGSPALLNLGNRLINAVGKSSIADVYQLLCNSKLFIGHDSMVSHLAAETLTPSIIISLGVVRPHETSPYSDKVINLAPRNNCFPCQIEKACDLLPCHGSINYQVVSTIAKGLLVGEVIDHSFLVNNLTPFHLNNLKVYNSSYQEDGLELFELTENYASLDEIFMSFYKVIWQYYLRGVERSIETPKVSKENAISLYEYIKGINYLYELYNFGIKYSNSIISNSESAKIDFKEIQDSISRIGEIDQLCSITKKTYPLLKGLVDYFYVNKANAQGESLIEISRSNLLNYYDAANLTTVLYDFIEKTIQPHIETQNTSKEV